MPFRIDTLEPGSEFVTVRVWATTDDDPRGPGSNCGILVFTLDEWFAFHALLAGRTEAVPVEFRGFDRARSALREVS